MSTNRQTIAFFWHHAAKYPYYVIGLIIGVPLALLAQQFLPPLIAAGVLERISQGEFAQNDLWGSFGKDLLLYAGLVSLGSIFAWRFLVVMIWRLESRVVQDISQRVFAHLSQQSASFHANRFGGSLVSQTGKFVSAYIRLADTSVFQVYVLLLSFVFTAIILWPKVPQYVIALFIFSALFIGTAFLATKKVRKLNVIEAEVQNRQTGFLADSITNILAVKSFAADNREERRFAEATEETRIASMNHMKAAVKRDMYFSSVTSAVTASSLALAVASVVYFQADIGTVFLVLSYTAMIVAKLAEFGRGTLRNYNRAFGDSQEMMKILALEPEVKDPPHPEKAHITKGEIDFQAVTFRHEETEGPIFEDFNLTIAPGEKIGVVGRSGAGKTTLTRLLLRFSDIEGGKILIDGQNIAKISQQDLRAAIAYVPQEPLLFHRSLKENISYGRPEATEKQIRLAAGKAHAAEFIKKLSEQYETMVGERGVKLSGGQRQRVAIARAILKDAPILVLDEATSALDSESEQLIQAALWELMKDRTAIVIAHRLSTIQKMDRIIVMNEGKIVEQGSHEQLLKLGGVYAELWTHQSGGFIS